MKMNMNNIYSYIYGKETTIEEREELYNMYDIPMGPRNDFPTKKHWKDFIDRETILIEPSEYDYAIYMSFKNGDYKLYGENTISVKVNNCSNVLMPLHYARILKENSNSYKDFIAQVKQIKKDMIADGEFAESLMPTIKVEK